MRALRKRSEKPLDLGLEEVDTPSPGPGHVLIEVQGAGICGTDLHIADGSYPSSPPVTMGHEVAGKVAEVGPGVSITWVGASVACETFFSTCGACPWCRSGRPNLCPQRRSIGSGVDGGFASFVVVPIGNLHRLPEGIPPRAAALSEPLACVCQSLLDPQVVEPGDDVVVFGPGPMGLLSAQIARRSGARVIVVGTDEDQERLAMAERLQFGAVVFGDPAITRAGGGYGPQVVIECSGNGAAMRSGLIALRRGGRYVQVGQTSKEVAVPLAQVSFKELRVTGGFASTPTSWSRAMALLEESAIDVESLVTEVWPLSDWEQAFAAIESSQGVKHVFRPED